MSIKIGHASIDENGKISGGKAGDQTGKEICVRSWYSKPWNVYLECTDRALANRAAEWMEKICANNNFGYDQGERWTGYNSIKKNGFEKAKGEFDCSSLVITCYILAGLEMSPDGYTGNLKSKLLKTGKFVEYTDSSHLLKDEFAKRGGIYLAEGKHVVMALEDGNAGKNPYNEPMLTVSLGSRGEGVKWVQWALKKDGYELEIDGSCGPITDATIREYQKKHGLEVDGKVGPKTRQCMRQ